jgi:hypothetical protein
MWLFPTPWRLFLSDVSALSDTRFHEEAKLCEMLCARSIKPFGLNRRRLRRML